MHVCLAAVVTPNLFISWRTILGNAANEKAPENIDNAIAAQALGE